LHFPKNWLKIQPLDIETVSSAVWSDTFCTRRLTSVTVRPPDRLSTQPGT
jgi:hypothetical protein